MCYVSDCCSAEVLLPFVDDCEDGVGMCRKCGEHCGLVCDECGNSGVVFDWESREWESCECGHPFDKSQAAAFHADLDPRNFT